MAETTASKPSFAPVSSSPLVFLVVGTGVGAKFPPSRVSSERGGSRVAGVGMVEMPLQLAFRTREGERVR